MDLLTLCRVLLRRWYVLLAFILITLLAVAWTYQHIVPSYQTTGSVLLLNPPAQTDPETGRSNPYVGNLIVAGQVVTNVLDSPAQRSVLKSRGATGTYTLGVDPTSPIIRVISTGDSPEESVTTTTTVMSYIDEVLAERQRQLNAPEKLYVTTQVVTPTSEPVPLNGSRTRAALALLALGGAVTVAAAFVVEGLFRRGRLPSRDAGTVSSPPISLDDAAVDCPHCGARLRRSQLKEHLERTWDARH